MPRQADVVIVGGGVIGVACALELADRGVGVMLLEREGGLGWGCSGGNAGLICPGHAHPLANPAALWLGLRCLVSRDPRFSLQPSLSLAPWLARFTAASAPRRVAMSRELLRALSDVSLEEHAALHERGLPTGFTQRGILNLYASEAALARAADEATGDGSVDVLSPDDARALAPGVVGPLAGALHHRADAHCDPLGFVEALGEAATAQGADIRTRVEVLGLAPRPSGGALLHTTDGDVHAGTVVLAAGAWTNELLPRRGALPLQGGKGYHVDLAAAPSDPALPLYLEERRVVITPLGDRLRLAGTLELTGTDTRVAPGRIEGLLAGAESVLGRIDRDRVVGVWRGLRPCTPDGVPAVGRMPGHPGVIVATGHAMLGLTLAPLTGRLVADIATGVPSLPQAERMSPRRFKTTPARGRLRARAATDHT